MLEFAPNTYMLEYQNGAYLCNGTKRIEAPLNLDTLEEAVRQCPKLQQVLLDDAPFGDQCFPTGGVVYKSRAHGSSLMT